MIRVNTVRGLSCLGDDANVSLEAYMMHTGARVIRVNKVRGLSCLGDHADVALEVSLGTTRSVVWVSEQGPLVIELVV